MVHHYWLLLCLFVCALSLSSTPFGYGYIMRSAEIHVAKGKFLIHMLHSANFFPQTSKLVRVVAGMLMDV